MRCTCVSMRSSFSRPIATCSSCRGVVRCSVAADADERLRDVERDVALEPRRLDLRLLAQPLGLQHAARSSPKDEDRDPAAGGVEVCAHQNRK